MRLMQIQVMARTKKSAMKNVDPRRGAKGPKKILPYKAMSTPHVYRPSLRARLEIRKYQKTTNLLVAHSPVNRILREILQEVRPGFSLREETVDALHHAGEDYAIKLLVECNALSDLAKRIAIMPTDLRIALRHRGARN